MEWLHEPEEKSQNSGRTQHTIRASGCFLQAGCLCKILLPCANNDYNLDAIYSKENVWKGFLCVRVCDWVSALKLTVIRLLMNVSVTQCECDGSVVVGATASKHTI